MWLGARRVALYSWRNSGISSVSKSLRTIAYVCASGPQVSASAQAPALKAWPAIVVSDCKLLTRYAQEAKKRRCPQNKESRSASHLEGLAAVQQGVEQQHRPVVAEAPGQGVV